MRIKQNDPTPEGYCRCIRCNWVWKPRVKAPSIPVACPDCLSRLWNGEKQ